MVRKKKTAARCVIADLKCNSIFCNHLAVLREMLLFFFFFLVEEVAIHVEVQYIEILFSETSQPYL